MEEQIMKVRTNVRAGGVMLMLLVSAIGLQGFASPAMARPRVVHAAGSFSLAFDLDTIELVPQGQQCLFYVNEVITYTGTLEGTSETVGPVQVRLFATCEEATSPDAVGIPSTFSAVEHFVGTDGKEATFRDVGRTDAAGNYEGIMAVHGDLNGILHVTGSGGPDGRYEGQLVLKD
jgi:hypothetical protein